jgi:glycosyltransferase involved in cell wall biosynthesis
VIRVGFDDQIFIAQSRGGISKYFVELIQRLPNYGIEPIILSTSTHNAHLAESGLVPRADAESARRSRLRGIWWRLTGRPRYRGPLLSGVDLIHHTFTHRAYLGLVDKPSVVTVYDMIPEVYPEYFPMGNPHFAKKRFAQNCDVVISISDSTTKDMLSFYGDGLAGKTVKVPFGVGEQFLGLDSEVEMPELPARYLLFVGIRRGYKHFITAFKAFEILAKDDETLHFIVIGGGRYSDEERKLIQASPFESRVMHFNPSDAQMPEFYKRAECFVFPSVYEGFGLPTLESLASGTPVVLADASCSREVGDDLAIYSEPGSIGSLVAAIKLASTADWAEKIRVEGPLRARIFTWDAVAEQTANVYKDLLARRQ